MRRTALFFLFAYLSAFVVIEAGAQAFSTPLNVSNNAGNSQAPLMVVDAGGGVNLLWNDGTAALGGWVFSRSVDHAASFSAPVPVGAGIGDTRFSRPFDVDAAGNVAVVWASGSTVYYSGSRVGGATFSAPTSVGTCTSTGVWPPATCHRPSVALDSSGRAFVVWENYGGTISFNKSADGLTFDPAAAQVLNANGEFPKVVIDASGGIGVSWVQGGSSLGYAYSSDLGEHFVVTSSRVGEMPGEDVLAADGAGAVYLASRVIFDHGTDAVFVRSLSGSLGVPLNISNTPLASAFPPLLLSARGSGNVFVGWPESAGSDGDKIIAMFNRSVDGGATFLGPMVPFDSTSGTLIAPVGTVQSAAGTVGTIINKDGTLLFLRATGQSATFGTPRNLTSLLGVIGSAVMGLDSADRVYVAWSDSRTGNNDVFISRADLGGNTPPTVSARSTTTSLECSNHGATPVVLTAVASDADADPLTIEWRDSNHVLLGSTAQITTTASLGSHTYTVTVSDGSVTASDSVTVTIADTIPPELSFTLSPAELWPADHKLDTVSANITVNDSCDPAPVVTLASIVSSEADAGLDKEDQPYDIQGAQIGTDDRSFQLRAERYATDPAYAYNGRTYTVTYRTNDTTGNARSVAGTVVVPKNNPN